MNKKLLLIPLALLLALSLVAIGCPAEKKVFELTIADIHPPQDPYNEIVNAAWFNWLEKESGGRIKMTLLHTSQAAAPADHLDAARTGLVDIACHLTSFTPGEFNIPFISLLPFVVDAPGATSAGLAMMELYEKYPEFQAEFQGVKVLLFHATDVFHVGMADKPIHTLEDFEGTVIEGQAPELGDMLTAFGAIPDFVGMEAPDAIAKGTLEGTLHNWTGITVFGFADVCNYYTDCALAGGPAFAHVMNLDTWNSLPPELQELFVGENAWTLAELYGYQVDKDTLVFRALINDMITGRGYPEIYVLPEDERARWMEATLQIREAWVQDLGSIIGEDTARAILEDFLEFTEKYSYENWPHDWQEDTLQEWAALE